MGEYGNHREWKINTYLRTFRGIAKGRERDGTRTEEEQAWENRWKKQTKGTRSMWTGSWSVLPIWPIPAPDHHSPTCTPTKHYSQLPTVWMHPQLRAQCVNASKYHIDSLLEWEAANLSSCRSRCQKLEKTRVWASDATDRVTKTHW